MLHVKQSIVIVQNIRVNVPWMTAGLKKSSSRCRLMYKNVARKLRNSPDFLNYKRYRNMINILRRKAKLAYYNKLIQENRQNSKKHWNILNKITGKNIDKKDVSAEILVNGIKEHNACTISNAYAKHYSEVGKLLANNIEKKGGIKDPMLNMKNRIENNLFSLSNYNSGNRKTY